MKIIITIQIPLCFIVKKNDIEFNIKRHYLGYSYFQVIIHSFKSVTRSHYRMMKIDAHLDLKLVIKMPHMLMISTVVDLHVNTVKPVCYYNNNTSTFEINLCEYGDVHPHPGPYNTRKDYDTSSPFTEVIQTKGLRFISQNICSLHAKITELRLIVQECRPHVIALMETKLNDAICDTELDIPAMIFIGGTELAMVGA